MVPPVFIALIQYDLNLAITGEPGFFTICSNSEQNPTKASGHLTGGGDFNFWTIAFHHPATLCKSFSLLISALELNIALIIQEENRLSRLTEHKIVFMENLAKRR